MDYDLERNTWCEPQIAGPKPLGRYGQTQVALDDDHLLVIGNFFPFITISNEDRTLAYHFGGSFCAEILLKLIFFRQRQTNGVG